jgi:hypothetical protein
MALIEYTDFSLPIRKDLLKAHERCWSRLSEVGTWVDGNHKGSIAAEVRNAQKCSFCAEQKKAISPSSYNRSHSTLGVLNDNEVEIIHRIVSDPARLSKVWFDEVISKGIQQEQYVEMVGIIAMVMVIDTFTFALGIKEHNLPKPKPGKPTYYKSQGAKTKAAWVPIVEPEDVTESDGNLYPNPKVGYILRSLSAVPQTKIDYWDLMHAHYLPEPIIYQFDRDYRAISRPQMELVAGRVSALHQCLF